MAARRLAPQRTLPSHLHLRLEERSLFEHLLRRLCGRLRCRRCGGRLPGLSAPHESTQRSVSTTRVDAAPCQHHTNAQSESEHLHTPPPTARRRAARLVARATPLVRAPRARTHAPAAERLYPRPRTWQASRQRCGPRADRAVVLDDLSDAMTSHDRRRARVPARAHRRRALAQTRPDHAAARREWRTNRAVRAHTTSRPVPRAASAINPPIRSISANSPRPRARLRAVAQRLARRRSSGGSRLALSR